MYAGTLVYNKTTRKLKTPTRKNPVDLWVKTAGAIDAAGGPAPVRTRQAILAQAALRYSPETMLQHLERLYREHGFLRASILRRTAGTLAVDVRDSLRVPRRGLPAALPLDRPRGAGRVETRLRREVGAVESHEDFLVVNRKFTVLVQPSVPVPHGYSQYWYFRPDGRGTVDITLGVPVSGPNGPTILGYLALPRLLVRDRGIRLFGSQQARLDMYGHTGLEAILELARS